MYPPNNQPPGSSWPPPPNPNPAPTQPAPPSPAAGARIVVVTRYPLLAYLYGLLTPTITINGYRQMRPWGTHYFDVPPGYYEVSVSYPWLFLTECGKNTARLTLQPGETRTVTYNACFIRYIPGSIRVS